MDGLPPFRSCVLLLLLLASGRALAQQGPIETDRPDQASTPAVVPTGWVQFEAGSVRTVSAPGADPVWTLPDVLLKAGLASWVELRSGVGWSQFRDADRTTRHVWRPMVVGAKAAVLKQQGWLPRTSLLAEVGIPGTGTATEHADEAFGSILVLADHDLCEGVSTTLNAGVQWDGERPDGVPVYTLSNGFDLWGRWKGFAELYGKFPLGGRAEHRWDAGFMWLPSDDWQLDMSGGRGFGDPQWFLNLGVSMRFRAWGGRP